ncbi:hypothetical protein DFJ73DRAFT_35000 [Zopfochytrium polystomum]|nr:hypothetical protein DFJ73DRAFT_35000 [Zopfochytrium polystomum]
MGRGTKIGRSCVATEVIHWAVGLVLYALHSQAHGRTDLNPSVSSSLSTDEDALGEFYREKDTTESILGSIKESITIERLIDCRSTSTAIESLSYHCAFPQRRSRVASI